MADLAKACPVCYSQSGGAALYSEVAAVIEALEGEYLAHVRPARRLTL